MDQLWEKCTFLCFPDGSVVKNPPAVQETQFQSLGREDPLEEEMVTHSSVLAWEIPGTKEPDRLQTTVSQRVAHDNYAPAARVYV